MSLESAVRALRVALTDTLEYWTVVDEGWRPVPVADGFLRHLRLAARPGRGHNSGLCRGPGLLFGVVRRARAGPGGGAKDLSLFVAMLKTAPVERAAAARGRARSARRVNHLLAAVRELYKHAVADGTLDASVLALLYEVGDDRHLPAELRPEGSGLRYRARPRHVQRARRGSRTAPVRRHEIEALLGACRSWRDRFLLVLLWFCGLRVGEALGFRRSDLHFVASAASLGCTVSGPHLHVVGRDNANGAPGEVWRAGGAGHARRARLLRPLPHRARRLPGCGGLRFRAGQLRPRTVRPTDDDRRSAQVAGAVLPACRALPGGYPSHVPARHGHRAFGPRRLDRRRKGAARPFLYPFDRAVLAPRPRRAAGCRGTARAYRLHQGGRVSVLAAADSARPRDADPLVETLDTAVLMAAGWDPLTVTFSPDSHHRLLGYQSCRVDGCGLEAWSPSGLCGGCLARFKKQGAATDIEVFSAKGPGRTNRSRDRCCVVCYVPGFKRPVATNELCASCDGLRRRRGQSVAGFVEGDEHYPPAAPRKSLGTCSVTSCRRLAAHPATGLCGAHESNWRSAGRPELAGFRQRSSPCLHDRSGRVVLAGLDGQVVLEVLYGVQAALAEGRQVMPTTLRSAVSHLRRSGAAGVAEGARSAPARTPVRWFLSFAADRAALARANVSTGYEKDLWDLRLFGSTGEALVHWRRDEPPIPRPAWEPPHRPGLASRSGKSLGSRSPLPHEARAGAGNDRRRRAVL